MRKGKSRKRRKETRRRRLWIAVAVIGIAAVAAAIFVAGMPETKNNAAHGDEMALAGKTKTAGTAETKALKEDADELIHICIDLYKKAEAENKLADLEMIRSMVNRLGENGYPAVDSKNQIDMAQAEQVERFCEMVDAQKRAEVTIIDIDYLGGLVKYDLQTKEGKVEVMRSDYEYKNGTMQRNFIGSYQAENWHYTEEGYLMFSGTYFSEELYALTLIRETQAC